MTMDQGQLSVFLGRQLSSAVRDKQPDRTVAIGQIVGGRLLIDGIEVPALWSPNALSISGTSCLCVRAGQRWVVVSGLSEIPTDIRPISGKLTGVVSGSSVVTVQYSIGGTTVTTDVPFVSGSSYAVGANVALGWWDGYTKPVVLGVLGTIPAPVNTGGGTAPPPPTAPTVTSGQELIRATNSATWKSRTSNTTGASSGSWVSKDWVEQDEWQEGGYTARKIGHWWYGDASKSKLAGKTIAKVELYIPVLSWNKDAPIEKVPLHFWSHTQSAATITAPQLSPIGDIYFIRDWWGGWVTVPNVWGNILVNNGGIAIAGTPWCGTWGAGSQGSCDPQSGAFRITWNK